MAYTVAKVYTQVCKVLLEDTGLGLTGYTSNDFLQDLLISTRQFLQESGLVKDAYTFTALAADSTYLVPDQYMEVQHVFWNGRYLMKNTSFNLDESNPRWESETGPPQQWHEDKINVNNIKIAPPPTVDGQITVIATVQPNITAYTMEGTIQLIPDSFCRYLKYFVLEKVFSQEGEYRDTLRASYCKARADEAINMAKAISNEELTDVS